MTSSWRSLSSIDLFLLDEVTQTHILGWYGYARADVDAATHAAYGGIPSIHPCIHSHPHTSTLILSQHLLTFSFLQLLLNSSLPHRSSSTPHPLLIHFSSTSHPSYQTHSFCFQDGTYLPRGEAISYQKVTNSIHHPSTHFIHPHPFNSSSSTFLHYSSVLCYWPLVHPLIPHHTHPLIHPLSSTTAPSNRRALLAIRMWCGSWLRIPRTRFFSPYPPTPRFARGTITRQENSKTNSKKILKFKKKSGKNW